MLTGRHLLGRQAEKLGLIDLSIPLRQLKNSAIPHIKHPPIPAKQNLSLKHKLLETPLARKLIANKMRATVAKRQHYPAPYALIELWEQYGWKKGNAIKDNKVKWQGDAQQLQDRLINKLLNAAQACLDERLVEDADLLDAGIIFGTGFAPFRGGPLTLSKENVIALGSVDTW
jgi:hypothetical protein